MITDALDQTEKMCQKEEIYQYFYWPHYMLTAFQQATVWKS